MQFGDTIVGNSSVVQVCGAGCQPESGPGTPGGWEATKNINTHPEGQALNSITWGNPPGHPSGLARALEPLRAFCWQRRRRRKPFSWGFAHRRTLWGCYRHREERPRVPWASEVKGAKAAVNPLLAGRLC